VSVTVRTLYNHRGVGYEMWNRWVFRLDRKTTTTEGAKVTSSGLQTVPDTSSSDWKSSVADGRQSGAADDQ